MSATLAFRITQAVRDHHAGVTVAMLMDALHHPTTRRIVSATCHSLAKRGFLCKETRPSPGTNRLVAWFRPSPALLAGTVRHSSGYVWRTEPIRAVLEAHGAVTLGDVVQRTGFSRRACHGALTAMIAGGEVERIGSGNQQRFTLASEEDDWTPPTTYISASRAYALGLR